MRKLMWFTIGFGAACAVCAYFAPSWALIAFLTGFLFCLIFAFLSRFHRAFAVVAVVAIGTSLGFGWFWCQDTAYLAKARALDGQETTAVVRITDFGYDTDHGIAADGTISIDNKTYRVRLYLNSKETLIPGTTITGTFAFRYTALGGEKNPTSHPSEGIYLLMYQRGEITLAHPENWQIRDFPAVWRWTLLRKIEEVFPSDTSGFAKALLLGDRTDIDYETNTNFKVSGISHIIAVSGLHISILFGLLNMLTFRRRWLTSLVGIPVLILFAATVGFTPSITRACIMQILMLLAMLAEREYDPPTALSFAALVILAVNPMSITSISFQLSFGCMAGIFLFSHRIQAFLESPKCLGPSNGSGFKAKCKRWFISSVSITISASVITTPLVAIYFGTVSLVSILTNLLTLWVISFVFYGIILTLVLSYLVPVVATAAAAIVSIPARYVLLISDILADFPLAAVYTQSIYIVVWLVICYLLLIAYLHCKTKYPVVFAACVAMCLCLALMLSWTEPLCDNLRVTALDVGQGQCILLQSDGKTYMVDCGGDRDADAADQAAEFLLSQGIDTLDGIILTHYDKDHTGGVELLLTRVHTDLLFLPDIADDSGVCRKLQALAGERAVMVQQDLTIALGNAQITIFASESRDLGNESGLCVLFQRENCDILITGDRGTTGETLLLQRVDLPKLELLIAGHHGSGGATGEALLAQTNPETVIISVGANNSYGHPANTLLERLAKFGCIVYRTDECGTVIYRR